MVAESAIYARDAVLENDKDKYLENSRVWLRDWVRGSRNHAAIILWSAENEMGVGWLKYFNSAQLLSLGEAIRKEDTTRPVSYDGDRDVGDRVVNWHYPEGYENSPRGSIYGWADRVQADKPTGVGEFITSYGPNEAANK